LDAAVFGESDETAVSGISSGLDSLPRIRLQIGGANIAGADRAWSPPCSSSFADEKRIGLLLLTTVERDPSGSVTASSTGADHRAGHPDRKRQM
jgi:hypothetical protein